MHRNSQKRYIVENAVYFIITNTFNRVEYFNEDILGKLLVEDLLETQRLKCFNLFAYKINPEHIHVLIQPRGKDSYSEIMRSFKTNFSRNANRVMGFDANFEKLIVSRPAGLPSNVPPQARSRDLACNDIPCDLACNDIPCDLACNDIPCDLACNDIPCDLACNDIPRNLAAGGASYNPGGNALSTRSILNDAVYLSRIAEYRQRFAAKYKFDALFPKFKWQGSFRDHIIRDRRDFVFHVEYIYQQWVKHKLSENKFCFIDHTLCNEAL